MQIQNNNNNNERVHLVHPCCAFRNNVYRLNKFALQFNFITMEDSRIEYIDEILSDSLG